MLSALVVLALAAEPPSNPPITLALPGLNAVNLNPGEGELYTELISQKFIEHGVKVMTARDLKSMLGLERQKALLGCAEESCVVEMTAALGADGVLVGDLGKLGTEYALNLKVLASKNGEPIALSNARAGDIHDLSRVIDNSVHAILRELSVKLNRPELMANTEPPAGVVAPASASTPSSLRKWSIAPAVLGVIGLGAGTAMQAVASSKYGQLSGGGLPQAEAFALRESGRGLETGGTVALIGGGVAVGAAVIMFLLGAERSTPTVIVTPSGGAIGIAGVLP